jgi:hypothetical protein
MSRKNPLQLAGSLVDNTIGEQNPSKVGILNITTPRDRELDNLQYPHILTILQ